MPEWVETEVKLHVPDLDAVAQRITAAGGVLAASRVFERNLRYDDPDRALTNAGIVLRLREDSRVRLTYKGAGREDGGALSREEVEVTLDDIDRMDAILRHLGYAPYVVYEKYRTTYELEDAEIVLDEMPYGHFVEIEATSAVIRELIARLALDDRPRIVDSYMGLFERVKQALDLDVHDLTFANFDGVEVPPAVFAQD